MNQLLSLTAVVGQARTIAGTEDGIAAVTAAGSTPDIDVTTAGTLTGQQPAY